MCAASFGTVEQSGYEFIEKIVVHEGNGRGKQRRQRLDFYFNFIGAFEVPADIVTPMEQEEERRQQLRGEIGSIQLGEFLQ